MEITIKIAIVATLIILLCSGGCDFFGAFRQNNTTVPTLNTSKNITASLKKIDKNTKEIKETTKNITQSAECIKDNISKIDDKIDDNTKEEIDVHLKSITDGSSSIITNAGNIDNNLDNISSSTSSIKESNKKIEKLENLVTTLEKERDAEIEKNKNLENKSEEQLNSMLIWLIGGSIIACAGFVVLFVFSGSKGGIIGAGASALVLIVATAMKVYFLYVAIFGGVLLLFIIGFMAYNIATKNKAFRELIHSVEVTKDNLDPKKKEQLFGGKGQTGIMGSIQSPATINMVKKEKSKINNLWDYAKNKIRKEED